MKTYTNLLAIAIFVSIACVHSVDGTVWKEKYYRHSRRLAILKDKPTDPPERFLSMGHRLLKEKFDGKQRSYADINSKFIKSDITILVNNRSCPSDHEISRTGVMTACPTYTVLERDDNRIPSAITQVKCRCLQCLGPWQDGASRRCTPLFDFKYVFRIVGKRHGHIHYSLVREPQSYACACLKHSPRSHSVMPP